jgi:hypothetical protein
MNKRLKMIRLVVCVLVSLVCATVICAEGSATAINGKLKGGSGKRANAVTESCQNNGDTLVMMARLADIPGDMPPNDVYNYVFIMNFKVTKIVKGNYTKSEILVGVYNPLIARRQLRDAMAANARGNADKFEVGASYRLTLVSPIEKVWPDAVEDNYPTSKLDKYYAVQVDVAH